MHVLVVLSLLWPAEAMFAVVCYAASRQYFSFSSRLRAPQQQIPCPIVVISFQASFFFFFYLVPLV
ncbi:hypothetical protein HDV64DRAFT_259048 [Trichoderma sp. TUCIM 5745]